MQVTLETTGNLGRRMTVAVPAERFEKEFAARLRRLSKSARFPGFRPGKAPMKLVEAQYGGKVLQEVVGDLIQATFYEAVSEKGLKPAGGPSIEPKSLSRGSDFEYVAVFEVYPEIAHLDIRGRRVERPAVDVTDADVERTVETLRKQRMRWQPVERSAQQGDRLVIDFVGRRGGEPFQGGEAKDYPLVLGANTLIEGFEDGLLGAASGETRRLKLTFPADYRNENLAGQEVEFEVTIKQVEEPVLPEVDAEFATQFGVANGSVETFRSEVRANLERERDERIRNLVRDQVFKAVMDANPFDIPKALEDAEVERLIGTTRASLQAQGLPADKIPPAEPAVFADQARRRVSLGLILAELVKVRGITAEPSRVRARIEQMAASYESPGEFVEWHYSRPERLSEIESLMLEEQAVELLLETAEVVDKPMSFKELVDSVTTGG